MRRVCVVRGSNKKEGVKKKNLGQDRSLSREQARGQRRGPGKGKRTGAAQGERVKGTGGVLDHLCGRKGKEFSANTGVGDSGVIGEKLLDQDSGSVKRGKLNPRTPKKKSRCGFWGGASEGEASSQRPLAGDVLGMVLPSPLGLEPTYRSGAWSSLGKSLGDTSEDVHYRKPRGARNQHRIPEVYLGSKENWTSGKKYQPPTKFEVSL